jgi:hypothetical protein
VIDSTEDVPFRENTTDDEVVIDSTEDVAFRENNDDEL